MIAGVGKKGQADPAWAQLDDEALLALRLCDLGLKLEDSPLAAPGGPIERVRGELADRGLRFRPHFWLSSEWFSPQGVPGVAIPFYLAHPRLMELERTQMLEVEGGTEASCLQLMRHELGHAIDTAFRLHYRKAWRTRFGRFTEPYEPYYKPRPYSRSFVLHLNSWYAQSHPAEDFAETFAVWLTPELDWRRRYAGWPALEKLEYVDALMAEIAGKTAPVRCREQTERVSTLKFTLAKHYDRKQQRYERTLPDCYDRDLQKLFGPRPSEAAGASSLVPAVTFMRKLRPLLRRRVSHWTGEYQYTTDQVLNQVIKRLAVLDLVVTRPVEEVREDALVMLTVHTMNYLHNGYHQLAR